VKRSTTTLINQRNLRGRDGQDGLPGHKEIVRPSEPKQKETQEFLVPMQVE